VRRDSRPQPILLTCLARRFLVNAPGSMPTMSTACSDTRPSRCSRVAAAVSSTSWRGANLRSCCGADEGKQGVLVSPTVFSGMMGPTAEDVADRTANSSAAAGLALLFGAAGPSLS
jgi:hypothetical protein